MLTQQKCIVFWFCRLEVTLLARLVSSEGHEGESIFHASPLASSGSLAIFGVPCFVEASSRSLPLFSHSVLLVHTSVSRLLLFLKIPDVSGWGLTLLRECLTLTNYISNSLQRGHIVGYRRLGLKPMNLGRGHNSNHNTMCLALDKPQRQRNKYGEARE